MLTPPHLDCRNIIRGTLFHFHDTKEVCCTPSFKRWNIHYHTTISRHRSACAFVNLNHKLLRVGRLNSQLLFRRLVIRLQSVNTAAKGGTSNQQKCALSHKLCLVGSWAAPQAFFNLRWPFLPPMASNVGQLMYQGAARRAAVWIAPLRGAYVYCVA